ncbi:MAG: helix-hairpin-helix domain-containing protein [Ferruginibacter sp.]
MDNYQIADNFSLLAKLLDIHGENSFKSKSYASSAFAIEKLNLPLTDTPREKIATIKGIGTSAAQKIIELLDTGKLAGLEEIIQKTPPGIIEMLSIKGIGPKKINTIWKEMEIENVGELLYACKENRLKLYKGFGEKTQANIIDTIEFYQKSKGSYLYAQVDTIAPLISDFLGKKLEGIQIAITGAFMQQEEVIHELEYVVATTAENIEKILLNAEGISLEESSENMLRYNSSAGIKIKLYPATQNSFFSTLIRTSSSVSFGAKLEQEYPHIFAENRQDEVTRFENAGLQYIPAALRYDVSSISLAKNRQLPQLIQPTDIKGIIHCHSNWSDGSNTLEEMAKAAIERGLQYLVISDHSKSAFYAQGLHEDKVRAQHQQIDELNQLLYPFKIFKSIESDILNDGSLDYSEDILASFDLVIASIHSNLKMTEEKAMMRLMKAIENPYTCILGHLTGRLLLSRPGYPINHQRIIDACAANQVVIELNAHPSRLDIDWKYIKQATEKNVMISIDPDSHHTDGLDDTRFGVMVAQKAMLQPKQNLSSFSLIDFETFLHARKKGKQL